MDENSASSSNTTAPDPIPPAIILQALWWLPARVSGYAVIIGPGMGVV